MDYALLALCFFSFIAGFIDSIVGGGGLVQVPAFFILYPQLAVPYIIGTNRLASAVGTSVAAWNYARTVRIPWKTVLFAGAMAAIFAYLGALVQSHLPTYILKPTIFFLIVLIAIYTFKNKTFGHEENIQLPHHKIPLYAALIGGIMGFYNGCIGPGTGSLLVFGFVSVIGYSFLRASAISKIVNVTADVFSLIFFFMNKYIIFHIALPMMACNVAGSFIGSKMAVLRGNVFVRQVFLVVLFGILLRFGWDIFKSFQ
jgi:uncharacterized protein